MDPSNENTDLAPAPSLILRSICHPLFVIDINDRIIEANDASEHFFRTGLTALKRKKITDLVPFGSPLLSLIEQVRQHGVPVNEYAVDLGTPLNTERKPVDLQVAPMQGASSADEQNGDGPAGTGRPVQSSSVLVLIFERAMANKIDRQLSHRSAAKSVTGLAAMLGHEIKNPLSGIRGAAQLLGLDLGPEEKPLTQLICDETDRICRLIDRMEVFSDERPLDGKPVNMHAVLNRVEQIASNGFANKVQFITEYDPSLPPILGDQDQLIQAFLNLVKNATESLGPRTTEGGIIRLRSAFRPGMRLSVPGSPKKVNLPLEFIVSDNGTGIPTDIMPHLFEPFVTSKSTGTGLGLPLVAKIVGDHGGVIEAETSGEGTLFRILLPVQDNSNLENRNFNETNLARTDEQASESGQANIATQPQKELPQEMN